MTSLWKQESLEGIFLYLPEYKNPSPAEKLCQGRNTFRGATLFHDVVLFARYYHISGMLTPALRCGILCQSFRRTLSGPFGRLPFHSILTR